MKRTKNMVYQPSHEARELQLFIENTELIYRKLDLLLNALKKKQTKGKYIPDRAIDGYYSIACDASDLYRKWFGYGFSVTDRFTAATDLEQDYRDRLNEF